MADEAMTTPVRQRRRGRKSMIALLLILLAIGGVGAFLWRLAPRRQPLLARAHRVMPLTVTAIWPRSGSLRINTPYAWETEHSLLQMTYRVGPDLKAKMVRVEAATGQAQDNAAFNPASNSFLSDAFYTFRTIPANPAPLAETGFFFAVSPDSRWMLWGSLGGASLSGNPRPVVTQGVDGSEAIETQKEGGSLHSLPFWLPDSRCWAQIAERDNHALSEYVLWLYDAQNPNSRSDYVIDVDSGDVVLGVTPDSRLLLARSPQLEQPASSRLVAASVDPLDRGDPPTFKQTPERHRAIVLITIPCGPQTGAPITNSVTAPSGLDTDTIREIALSPVGDRLAWIVTVNHNAHATPFVKTLLRLFRDRERLQTVLWTTKLDGSEPREIGYIDTAPNETPIEDLRWVPGGRRLSFRYKDTLYTVPAD